MKYFEFLYYLLSYTTGIGAVTLLILQYLRYNKTLILRELLFFDLCFTVHFILEMLRPFDYSAWIQSSFMVGTFFTNIGLAYFIAAYFYRILNREIDPQFKTLLWSGAALTGGILILLYPLSQKYPGIKSTAIHTGDTVIDIFLFLMIGYSIYVTAKNLNKLDRERKLMAIIAIVALTTSPASVIQNFLWYRVQLKHPVAFTPLSYIIINVAIIFYYIRNYINAIPAEITVLHAFDKENLRLSHAAIIKEHNITERELEVLQLILSGYSNHEISKKLFISSNTARNHIYSIFKKLDVKSRLELSKIFY
jgi:DNA-binding CsgD family transcriptional regulator